MTSIGVIIISRRWFGNIFLLVIYSVQEKRWNSLGIRLGLRDGCSNILLWFPFRTNKSFVFFLIKIAERWLVESKLVIVWLQCLELLPNKVCNLFLFDKWFQSWIKTNDFRSSRSVVVCLTVDHVQLSTIAGVFHRHHIQVTENSLALELAEMDAILNDIFFAASKESSRHLLQVDVCTELTLHFLLSIFDRFAAFNITQS